MILASKVFKKSTIQKLNHSNALVSKLDLDLVNLGSSFEQTWYAPHPQCYIPSLKATGLLVLEKIFKRFLPYMDVAAIFVM